MNLAMKQKSNHGHREQTGGCHGGGWEWLWIGSVGLADANYYVQNG